MLQFLQNNWGGLAIVAVVINLAMIPPFFIQFFRGSFSGFSGGLRTANEVMEDTSEVTEENFVSVALGGVLKMAGAFFGPVAKKMAPFIIIGFFDLVLYGMALVGFISWLIKNS